MRLLARLLFALMLPLGLLIGAGALLLAASDPAPLVRREPAISPDSIGLARALLDAHDPRTLQAGEEGELRLPARLIDDGLNHLAHRYFAGSADFALDAGGGRIRVSLPLPGSGGERYLNLQAALLAGDAPPQFADAHLGRVALPSAVLQLALGVAADLLGQGEAWQLGRRAIRRVELDPATAVVALRYSWLPEILERARAAALPAADVARLEDAQRRLAALLSPWAPGTRRPLADVLQAMLAVDGDDAFARQRAALLVLASQAAGRDLSPVVPAARDWPAVQPVALVLRGRRDSAQHFVVSAALAAWAGEPVADAIGLYKEIADARGGSGFSFADLAADRAGTRFGETLRREPARLAALHGGRLTDDELAPRLDDLPEFLPEAEFVRRFGGIDGPGYRRLAAEIERRIDALPPYR